MKRTLMAMLRRMEKRYGRTGWWPGDTPFEIAAGAILTQNTAWTNVEKAIANLKRDSLLRPETIANSPDTKLQEALRPSGYFRVKTKRLRAFCAHLVEHYGGSVERMAERPTAELRRELLGIHGIGPETADDILLYACDKPVFVVDAYTRRILSRHGHCQHGISYGRLRALFQDNLPADIDLWKEFHALIVYTGKDYCRANPLCEGCPLQPMLKPGQPCLEPQPSRH